MSINSLSASSQSSQRQLPRQETKQQFFSIKAKPKRMKISQCFTEPLKRCSTPNSFDDLSVLEQMRKDVENEQLESTFGFQYPLTFTPRRPRRKQFKKHKQAAQNMSHTPSVNLITRRLSLQTPKMLEQEPFQQGGQVHFQKEFHTFRSGLTIQDFIICQKLGEGTYSEVYRAIQRHTGFMCALKVLSKAKIIEEGLLDNVTRQLKICLFLDHPNIAKLYGFFSDYNHIYLLSEYATDKNIFELVHKPRIKLKKGLMTDKVVNIIGQLASAVKYLHKNNVIHRDIKPQNILVTFSQTIKLCDFGWSVYNPNKEMRATLCGTLLYLAPQIVALKEYDESVDVWSLGVLTYELMTDSSPFNITRMTDIKNILKDEVKFQGIRNKTAVEFMVKALQKDPNKRKDIYQLSMDPFLQAFSQDCFFQF